MDIPKTHWLEDFDETCQAIMEDAFLLDALAVYMTAGGQSARAEWAGCFPSVLLRLCDYLSQHASDLHDLEKRIRPDLS